MNPEAINRACAELCGWKLAKSAYGDYEVLYRPDGSECRHCYNSGEWETLSSFGQALHYKKFADFTTSLDAAQMAFKALTPPQRTDACWLLVELFKQPAMLATPLQWCEAILKAAGKWEETTP